MAALPCGWRSWSRKAIWAGSPPTPSQARTKLGRRQRKTHPSRQAKRHWGLWMCTAAPTRFPSKAPSIAVGSAGPALRTCGSSKGGLAPPECGREWRALPYQKIAAPSLYNCCCAAGNPTSCPSPGSAAPTGTTNNGNVMGYWYQDSVNSSFGHTASYGYDGVNRLNAACTLSGSQCATSGSNVYNLACAYDQFGNMHATGGVGGGSAIGYCPAWAYNNSTNQLSSSTGCAYDAAGNLTKDCSTASNHTYQWDAEGRVASVDSGSTWSFTYNALGERVQMAGPGGTQELMYDPSGVWLGIYGVVDILPWGGGYFAWYNGTDTSFNHINNISSTSVLTNHAGTAVEDVLFYPWGQNTWQFTGSGGYSFAELPYYDTTTDTNLTPFRFYSPGLGRWLSPDPAGGDPTNPQSLNRYPYVLNNPTTLTDPVGLQGCPAGTSEIGPGQCAGPLSPLVDPVWQGLLWNDL